MFSFGPVKGDCWNGGYIFFFFFFLIESIGILRLNVYVRRVQGNWYLSAFENAFGTVKSLSSRTLTVEMLLIYVRQVRRLEFLLGSVALLLSKCSSKVLLL